MKSVSVRTVVTSTTYKGLIEEAEKKLANFFEIDYEDVKDKLSYEILIHESSYDGKTLPIFSGEILCKIRN
jgi:hypothetical protein